MTTTEGKTPEENEQQVSHLFDSPELTQAIETEEFRVFLDHIPIAIVISKLTQANTYSDRTRSQGASSDPGEGSLARRLNGRQLYVWHAVDSEGEGLTGGVAFR